MPFSNTQTLSLRQSQSPVCVAVPVETGGRSEWASHSESDSELGTSESARRRCANCPVEKYK